MKIRIFWEDNFSTFDIIRNNADFIFDIIPKSIDIILFPCYNMPTNLYVGGFSMIKSMSTKDAEKLWGISQRRIISLCQQGKIRGVVKNGRAWEIPLDAEKPMDGRFKTGAYAKHSIVRKLPLPIGISDYRLASTEYYYIDKTMLIKDFLDERPMVSLFTRPRRFGKTLNMDMLRTFFEKTEDDTSIYFKNKKIWACGEDYRKFQGKYPVIFLSFKDVKFNTWEETFKALKDLFAKETSRHIELADNAKLGVYDKKKIEKLMLGEISSIELSNALADLSRVLHEYHGIAPIIIIDEYDTPIQQGHAKGFYDEVVSFMRNLFSGGLKDNKHLSYGFLTGILRVAKESIFSGLNNLTINSILDEKYSDYFGFTTDEIRQIALYYGATDKYDELSAWYDGYKFGNVEIFNPWSVINYFRNNCQARAYWQATGNNDIIGEILEEATKDVYEKLNALMQGDSILTYVDTGVIYPQVKSNPSSIYSFLLVAGYLKVVKSSVSYNGDFMCEVALPNKEIAFVYNKEILQKLDNIVPQATAISIQEAIYSSNVTALKTYLELLLMQSASSYDTVKENFYHGLILGLCATLDNRYYVTSNREAGEGRYDICLCPKDAKMPGILIELKACKDCTGKELKQLSVKALNQINEKKYETELCSRGISTIFKYGVAFSGKRVEITAN